MKLKKIVLIISLPIYAMACIWIDGTTIHGTHEYQKATQMMFQASLNETPKDKLKYYYRSDEYKKLQGIQKQEVDAVKLLLEGNTTQAIEILKEVEAQSSHYSVASNLGTAYELNGDNKNALIWIREGIKRNPESHYGTEWLHALILQAKITLENNASYLKTNRIISLSSDFKNNRTITIDGKKYTLQEITKALNYQLQERMVFIKPKNIVVADLLYSYAIITAHQSTLEEALYLLKLSHEYGFANPKLLSQTQQKYQEILDNPSIWYYLKYLTENPQMLLIVVVILILIELYRKQRKKNEIE